MKEVNKEKEIRRKDGGIIMGRVWWKRGVEVTFGRRYRGNNLHKLDETIINKHYFNYERR